MRSDCHNEQRNDDEFLCALEHAAGLQALHSGSITVREATQHLSSLVERLRRMILCGHLVGVSLAQNEREQIWREIAGSSSSPTTEKFPAPVAQ